jgi:class 3 adenylate cyclase
MSLKRLVSELEVQIIHKKLDLGVAHRASNNCFVYSLVFSIYGIMSTGIISKFDPNVTVFNNSWPRLLFNGLPFLLLGLYFKKEDGNPYLKTLIWAIGQPLIFVLACCIHVWPLMHDGHLELYKYFHAANMFVVTFGITYVAPARKVLVIHMTTYIALFLLPLIYLSRNDIDLASMIVNDFICMTLGASIAGHFTYRLRKKIAFLDAQIKSTVTPLVGNAVASAIYSQRLDNLNNKSAYGLILTMDLRGYTQFMHNSPRDVSAAFMKEYHFLVSTSVGKYNGFIHKTAGDGHLISFGLMDESADLSDIPELRFEVISAEINKSKILAESVEKMFDELIEKYEQLKAKYDVTENLRIGAALASGNIEIKIQGNQNYRLEVNIDGDTIVRGARLEAYTKLMLQQFSPESSLLVYSPEIIENLKCQTALEEWNIQNPSQSVRDYPSIKRLYYKVWRHKAVKPKRIAS